MTLVSKDAVLEAARTAIAGSIERERVSVSKGSAPFSPAFRYATTIEDVEEAIRSLPAHRWSDGEIEAAARILSQWVVVDRSETVERQKSALLADARAILDAAMGAGEEKP